MSIFRRLSPLCTPASQENMRPRPPGEAQGVLSAMAAGLAAVWKFTTSNLLLRTRLRANHQPPQADRDQNLMMEADIAARRQTEAAYTQEQSLLRCLIDSVPDLIFFKDKNSR